VGVREDEWSTTERDGWILYLVDFPCHMLSIEIVKNMRLCKGPLWFNVSSAAAQVANHISSHQAKGILPTPGRPDVEHGGLEFPFLD